MGKMLILRATSVAVCVLALAACSPQGLLPAQKLQASSGPVRAVVTSCSRTGSRTTVRVRFHAAGFPGHLDLVGWNGVSATLDGKAVKLTFDGGRTPLGATVNTLTFIGQPFDRVELRQVTLEVPAPQTIRVSALPLLAGRDIPSPFGRARIASVSRSGSRVDLTITMVASPADGLQNEGPDSELRIGAKVSTVVSASTGPGLEDVSFHDLPQVGAATLTLDNWRVFQLAPLSILLPQICSWG